MRQPSVANTVTLLCPAFYVFTILPQHGDSPFHLSGFTTVFILAIQKKKSSISCMVCGISAVFPGEIVF